MEIVFKKPIGHKKVDSRLLLAVKSKKKKQRSEKKSIPSLKTLRSDSTFLSTNRLSNRIGIFSKGKVSHHVKRSPNCTPQTKARVEQDLRRVVELVSTQNNKRSRHYYHRENSPDIDASFTPVEDVSSYARNVLLPRVSPIIVQEQIYDSSQNSNISSAGSSHEKVSLSRSSPVVKQDRRRSYSQSTASNEVPARKILLSPYFDSMSDQLNIETKKNGLCYWDRSSYLQLKQILQSKPNERTLSMPSATQSKHNTPASSCTPEKSETVTSEEFVLNVCSEFRKKISPKPLECFDNKENHSNMQQASCSKFESLGSDPAKVAFQLPSCQELDLEREFENLHELIDSRNYDLYKSYVPDVANRTDKPKSVEIKSLKENLLSSPIRPPLEEAETPKVFFRRKMF